MNSFLDAAKRTRVLAICLMATVVMAPLAALGQGGEADAREVRNYKLTMDKIKKADQALQSLTRDAAVRAAIRKAAAEQQAKEEARAAAGEEEEQSLSSTVKKMEALHPAVKSAFQSAGISTREYVVLSLAWFQAGFAAEMKKSGTIKEVPPDISKENVVFIEANAKELQAVADRWKKLTEELGLGAQNEQ